MITRQYEILKAAHVPRELAFSEDEYRARVARVRVAMVAEGLDLLVLANIASTGYLTGYDSHMPSSYQVTVVPRTGDVTLMCGDNETAVALVHAVVDDVIPLVWTAADEATTSLAALVHQLGFERGRIGLELAKDENFSAGAYDADSYLRLKELLPRATLVDATRLVLEQRLIKSEAELAHMRKAGEFTWAGLRASIEATHEGVNENEIAAAGYAGCVGAGSELMSIDPMVMTGPRTGLMPHLPYRRRTVDRGDAVYMEYGATYWRYTAPMMRTTVIGSPAPRMRQLAETSIALVETVIEEARPGRTGHDVATAVTQRGLWDQIPGAYNHGVYAYAVGLGYQPSWCEQAVYIADGQERELKPGMTFHVPMCIWYPAEFGVGFSETIVITADGCELLTPGTDRHLVIR